MNPLEIVAALRLEDGRTWGEAAESWQVEDARAVLFGNALNNFLTRPRGASKTTDLAAVALAVLLTQAPPASRSYAVAVDSDQAARLLDAIRGFVLRSPDLGRSLTVEARRVVVKGTQATLDVLAADAASAWGLLPYFVVCDELSAWKSTPNARGMWTATVSAMPKVPGSRLVVLTSAGDPAHWSHKVLEHARASGAWRVNEVAGPCPWIAPEALEEQRALLTESQYARLHLNRWTAAEDRLVRPENLRACVSLDGPQPARPGVEYVMGVDIGLRHDRTVISVCHAERDEDDPRRRRVVLDRMIVFEGSRAREVQLVDVEATIVEAWRAYNRPRVLADIWQMASSKQRLERRGVRIDEFTFSPQNVGRLAATLHLLLRNQLLALPDDEALIDELANVRLRETSPGVLRMQHDADRHDDRAIALALAAQALVGTGEPMPATLTSAVDRTLAPTGPIKPPKRIRMSKQFPEYPSIAGRRRS